MAFEVGELIGDVWGVGVNSRWRGEICVEVYVQIFVNISASDSYGIELLVAWELQRALGT